MVTDRQVRRLMSLLQSEQSLQICAEKVGMDRERRNSKVSGTTFTRSVLPRPPARSQGDFQSESHGRFLTQSGSPSGRPRSRLVCTASSSAAVSAGSPAPPNQANAASARATATP